LHLANELDKSDERATGPVRSAPVFGITLD
jgi:hypothetical protein